MNWRRLIITESPGRALGHSEYQLANFIFSCLYLVSHFANSFFSPTVLYYDKITEPHAIARARLERTNMPQLQTRSSNILHNKP